MTYVEPEYLLNEYFADEMAIASAVSSSPANYEVCVHEFEFTVSEACRAFLNVHAPIAVHNYETNQHFNGAGRVYHNGDNWTVFPSARQWNSPGGASVGGGQWNHGYAWPSNGLLEGHREINLTAGRNTIRVHLATNSPLESIRLMGPRWFQVYRLKVVP